jgi:hypothetical protein
MNEYYDETPPELYAEQPPVDPTWQAAEAIHSVYGPELARQAAQIDMLAQAAAANMQHNTLEQKAVDEKFADEAMKLAEERSRFPSSWWTNPDNRREVANAIAQRPELFMPDAALTNKERVADAINVAAEVLHAEAIMQQQRQRGAQTNDELKEMSAALDRSNAMRTITRELGRRS